MMMPVETFLDGEERAGPDIAISHTRGEGKRLVLEVVRIGFSIRGGDDASIARIGRSIQITPA